MRVVLVCLWILMLAHSGEGRDCEYEDSFNQGQFRCWEKSSNPPIECGYHSPKKGSFYSSKENEDMYWGSSTPYSSGFPTDCHYKCSYRNDDEEKIKNEYCGLPMESGRGGSNGNVVIGNGNVVKGSNNGVKGDDNGVDGHHNGVDGDSNSVHGLRNNVQGDNKIVVGNDIEVEDK